MTAKIRTVLFDLDGTIIDTNELIIESFLHALQGIVPEGFGREHIIPSMGLPLVTQLQQFSGREQVDDLARSYREYNLLRHDEMVTLFPGVGEVVPKLHAAGIRLGIVTTKMKPSTERALKLLGIYDYMGAIVTLDDVEHAKPHPEPVLKAIEALGADPETTIMVGDSKVDIESARNAGAIPVGVAWSLKGEGILKDAGAAHIIQEMDQLLTICGLER
ncbi:pyrophosphatase PpaX [Cohnella thailandensis]|uniref:Pyrophosphatase PpaX n=1 Tax=Cohnella thailandensis TaxID=557557 RepID=A0A841T3H9_9BACL|nr:pyrophosphatase PpaX [Cohnella thailandensis]MBB6637549.1 pyrophosphatase PpaX [Cohnella thailandensis]MBP1974275.1 pyrophosphatase PpaX [Cohnella thailandensis]